MTCCRYKLKKNYSLDEEVGSASKDFLFSLREVLCSVTAYS